MSRGTCRPRPWPPPRLVDLVERAEERHGGEQQADQQVAGAAPAHAARGDAQPSRAARGSGGGRARRRGSGGCRGPTSGRSCPCARRRPTQQRAGERADLVQRNTTPNSMPTWRVPNMSATSPEVSGTVESQSSPRARRTAAPTRCDGGDQDEQREGDPAAEVDAAQQQPPRVLAAEDPGRVRADHVEQADQRQRPRGQAWLNPRSVRYGGRWVEMNAMWKPHTKKPQVSIR